MHMFASAIKEGKSITGYINNGLVMTHLIHLRHDDLVEEMEARGYNHKTPIEKPAVEPAGFINVYENLRVLRERCDECRRLQDEKKDLQVYSGAF
jgi:hypothetical protein